LQVTDIECGVYANVLVGLEQNVAALVLAESGQFDSRWYEPTGISEKT